MAMSASIFRLALFTVVVTALLMLGVEAEEEKKLVKRSVNEHFSLKDKRPFCNAFTGCGRKRSSLPPLQSLETDRELREGEGSYEQELDSRAELEELARHVLAQARLWEQLQSKVELLKSMASAYPDQTRREPYRRRKRRAIFATNENGQADQLNKDRQATDQPQIEKRAVDREEGPE